MHFEVLGRDGAALRAFYGELFDWRYNNAGGPMDYATIDPKDNEGPQGGGIGGGIGATPDGAPQVTFYVAVADAEAALVKAEALGGKRRHGPDEVPGAGIIIAKFDDPEGNVVGLVQPLGTGG